MTGAGERPGLAVTEPWDGTGETGTVPRPGFKAASFVIQRGDFDDDGLIVWQVFSHLRMTPLASGTATSVEDARAQVAATFTGPAAGPIPAT